VVNYQFNEFNNPLARFPLNLSFKPYKKEVSKSFKFNNSLNLLFSNLFKIFITYKLWKHFTYNLFPEFIAITFAA
jgi:hypothetical protein